MDASMSIFAFSSFGSVVFSKNQQTMNNKDDYKPSACSSATLFNINATIIVSRCSRTNRELPIKAGLTTPTT